MEVDPCNYPRGNLPESNLSEPPILAYRGFIVLTAFVDHDAYRFLGPTKMV